jgi:hypothetical protein
MKGFLRWVHIDLVCEVNAHDSHAYAHLIDLEIVLGGDGEFQPNVAEENSRCIRGLVVDAFNVVISSTK